MSASTSGAARSRTAEPAEHRPQQRVLLRVKRRRNDAPLDELYLEPPQPAAKRLRQANLTQSFSRIGLESSNYDESKEIVPVQGSPSDSSPPADQVGKPRTVLRRKLFRRVNPKESAVLQALQQTIRRPSTGSHAASVSFKSSQALSDPALVSQRHLQIHLNQARAARQSRVRELRSQGPADHAGAKRAPAAAAEGSSGIRVIDINAIPAAPSNTPSGSSHASPMFPVTTTEGHPESADQQPSAPSVASPGSPSEQRAADFDRDDDADDDEDYVYDHFLEVEEEGVEADGPVQAPNDASSARQLMARPVSSSGDWELARAPLTNTPKGVTRSLASEPREDLSELSRSSLRDPPKPVPVAPGIVDGNKRSRFVPRTPKDSAAKTSTAMAVPQFELPGPTYTGSEDEDEDEDEPVFDLGPTIDTSSFVVYPRQGGSTPSYGNNPRGGGLTAFVTLEPELQQLIWESVEDDAADDEDDLLFVDSEDERRTRAASKALGVRAKLLADAGRDEPEEPEADEDSNDEDHPWNDYPDADSQPGSDVEEADFYDGVGVVTRHDARQSSRRQHRAPQFPVDSRGGSSGGGGGGGGKPCARPFDMEESYDEDDGQSDDAAGAADVFGYHSHHGGRSDRRVGFREMVGTMMLDQLDSGIDSRQAQRMAQRLPLGFGQQPPPQQKQQRLQRGLAAAGRVPHQFDDDDDDEDEPASTILLPDPTRWNRGGGGGGSREQRLEMLRQANQPSFRSNRLNRNVDLAGLLGADAPIPSAAAVSVGGGGGPHGHMDDVEDLEPRLDDGDDDDDDDEDEDEDVEDIVERSAARFGFFARGTHDLSSDPSDDDVPVYDRWS